MSALPNSSSSSSSSHDFCRDRSTKSCMICSDLWPSGDGVISKFNTCTRCKLRVHSSCVDIAKQCYRCDEQAVADKLQSHKDHSLNFEGRVSARVLHCYDIDVTPGSNLYYDLNISTGDASIKGR